MISKKLYVDDLRHCPDGWDVARNFHQAIVMLEDNDYDEISLDHDIASFYGNREMTGDDILQWLIDRKVNNLGHTPNKIYVHSANPVKKPVMIDSIKRVWGYDEN